MKEHNKRWLMSKLKSSGSRKRYLTNGSFSDDRNTKKYQNIENLPQYESIESTWKLYNGKINYGPLIRFLRTQVGNDWDDVYAEIIARIPTKIMYNKDVIFRLVATNVAIIDNKPFNQTSNQFIWTPEQGTFNFNDFDMVDFYIEPSTNKLQKVADKPKKRV